MEGLIIMIIIFVVSSLLGKGKEQQKKESNQMPPFSSQPAPRKQEVEQRTEQRRPKSLEDFANEVFGQLNEKAKPVAQQMTQELPKQVEKPVIEAKRVITDARIDNPNSARSLKERPIVALAKKEAEAFQVVPTSQRDLMQAVIMTEVLGPPKSRRR